MEGVDAQVDPAENAKTTTLFNIVAAVLLFSLLLFLLSFFPPLSFL